MPSSVYVVKLGVLRFGMYMLLDGFFFNSKKWPSSSLLTDFILKSVLSEMRIVTPSWLGVHLLEKSFLFSHSLCSSFPARSVPCRQQVIRPCFLILLTILCLLIRELRTLTFSVNIESYVVFSVILLFLWCLHLSFSFFANLLI
jgi:hypothetical protein